MMQIPLQYNLRNLMVRKVTTVMTSGGIALVVTAFVALAALAEGLDQTMASTGSVRNVVITSKGAIADAASSMTIEQFRGASDLVHLDHDGKGQALISPELVFQVPQTKLDGGVAHVIVRGVRPISFQVHEGLRISRGRTLAIRSGELLVGRGVVSRYRGLDVGSRVRLFQRDFIIVGELDNRGGYFESEIWCDLDDLMSDSRRTYYSVAFARLSPGSIAHDLSEACETDPRINLQARPETEYFEEQSEAARNMRALGRVIAVTMAIGAVFVAMNTMYAAISARTKEIATLRALGFSRGSIVASFTIESMLLALPGGIVGTALAFGFDGTTTGMMNHRTFADVSFAIRVTPWVCLQGILFSLIIGFVGGLLPASSGAQVPIVTALREV